MRKLLCFLLCLIATVALSGCDGASYSAGKYDEIKEYVEENADNTAVTGDTEFFTYKTNGLSIGGVYYGYYYSENNEVLVPDFYSGSGPGKAETKDGGTYFGRPNDGTDWCFVRQIKDRWFYFELHWG